MSLFPRLWEQLCLEGEFYTCPAFSLMVSEVGLMDDLSSNWTKHERFTGHEFVFSAAYCEDGWKERTSSWPLTTYCIQCHLYCGEEQS